MVSESVDGLVRNAMRIDELERRLKLLEKFVEDFSAQTREVLDLIAEVIQTDLDPRAL
jgi:cell fate (sporulation/competence/biofilm development) regulator YmcA (YheA/YmcA/DUF963 family)